ncbi:MAG: hypothetical protein Q9176_004918 [Flavoplaca citrina]
MDNAKASIFKSDIFKIITGSASQPIYVHADVLARSDLLRRLIAGPWKESIDRAIDWSEWDSSVVEKFIEWLYTGDYSCPHPVPNPLSIELDNIVETVKRLRDGDNQAVTGGAENRAAGGPTEGQANKKAMTKMDEDILLLQDLEWKADNGLPLPSPAEEFNHWHLHPPRNAGQLDYSVPFKIHADLYNIGCRYFLDDLRRMAWYRLRTLLITIGRPPVGSAAIQNTIDLILDVYSRTGDPLDEGEPLRNLLTTFVACHFTAFKASGIQQLAISDNKDTREFMSDLMAKLMLRVEKLESEGPKASPFSLSTSSARTLFG